MGDRTQAEIPTFVRMKPGALKRLGIYASRHGHRRLALIVSAGILPELFEPAEQSLKEHGSEQFPRIEAETASFERATTLLAQLPETCQAIVGLGGGKALDVAKYVAHLAQRPFYSVPTSLSHDGFCSPQSSLTLQGRRRSFSARMPFAVVVDTEVCRQAPKPLWWSGIGDLLAKVTAVFDWKLAYHQRGEPVNDLAALLSDATVFQFLARPTRDPEGIRVLATGLMLNGIAMAISGSSRPASGSEHLISHALDELSSRPRLHGLQVGMATYLVSRLQGQGTERVTEAFDRSGFWEGIRDDPFSRSEWIEAVARAPALRPDRFTILSTRPVAFEIQDWIENDPRLQRCFND